MDWAGVIKKPFLQDLPFKIELNKWDQPLMSPANNNHGILQYELGGYIDRRRGTGTIIMECSVDTPDGVKVADVAWASDEFVGKYGFDTPYEKAPEICVEMTSPSTLGAKSRKKFPYISARCP